MVYQSVDMALRYSEKMNIARFFYSVDLCYCVRVPSSLSTCTSVVGRGLGMRFI